MTRLTTCATASHSYCFPCKETPVMKKTMGLARVVVLCLFTFIPF